MIKKSHLVALGLVVAFGSAQTAFAGAVDLNDWTVEDSSAGASNWSIAGDGSSAFQSINGNPTVLYSDFNGHGTEVTGKIKVETSSDDDYIGFVLGFDPGDFSNSAADYLLLDWKQGNQTFNFPGPDPGGLGRAGVAVSRVSGIASLDEFWQHATLGPSGGGGLTELARGTTLGSTGWADNTEYEFSFDFGPGNLVVKVDGVEQINITGSFSNGRIGFYNFSQSNVRYSAFEEDVGTFPTVPLPPAAWMGLAALGLMAATRRRRRHG